jgi:hypothetical protein
VRTRNHANGEGVRGGTEEEWEGWDGESIDESVKRDRGVGVIMGAGVFNRI